MATTKCLGLHVELDLVKVESSATRGEFFNEIVGGILTMKVTAVTLHEFLQRVSVAFMYVCM